MENIVFAVWVSGRLEFCADDKRACFETAKSLVEIAVKVRKQGLLSIDGEIPAMHNIFRKKALQMAVDSVEPAVIRDVMQNWIISGNYRGAELLKRLITIEGVLMIINGYNPAYINEVLSSYFGEDLLQEYVQYIKDWKQVQDSLHKSVIIEDFWYKIKDGQRHREPGSNLLEEIFRKLDNMSVQLIIRNIEMADLVIAARGSSEYVINRIIRNVSSGTAQDIVDNIYYASRFRLRDIIAAQNRILARIKELEDRGEIVFKDKSET